MGYYLFDHAKGSFTRSDAHAVPPSDERLRSLLEEGTQTQRRYALQQLIERQAEGALMGSLASSSAAVTQLAIHGLWECWLGEQGPVARARIDAGIVAMNEGSLAAAAAIFAALIAEYPHWAEPINKQATVLYLQGLPDQSITLCRRVIGMKPDHFGAWNGLALCAIQTENWSLAMEAVQQSLRLQPRSGTNIQLFKLVGSRLPSA